MKRLHISLCILLSLLTSPVFAWHSLVSLQSTSTNNLVSLPAGASGPIRASLSPFTPSSGSGGPDGSERFTLLDINNGYLWHNNDIAIRRADGLFVAASPAAGSGIRTLGVEALQLVTDANGLRDMDPRFRFRIRVAEPGGKCPGALKLDDPSSSTPSPAPEPTDRITDGCLIILTTADGMHYVVINSAGILELLPNTIIVPGLPTPPLPEKFRLRLLGLPPTLMLSSPVLQTNYLMPLVVHVDHSRGVREAGCVDAKGFPARPHHACYPGHEGTDFLLHPNRVKFTAPTLDTRPGVTFEGADILAAAPGRVVWTQTQNFDRCYFNPINNCSQRDIRNNNPSCPNPVDDSYSQLIKCDRLPAGVSGKTDANMVIVIQDDGLIVRYVHLKKGSVRVKPGERVECGQWIGVMASSGTSAVPHLHFDMSKPKFIDAPRPKWETEQLPGDETDGNWIIDDKAATQGTDELVDPYDSRDANGRSTLWAALHDDMRPSRLPRLTCPHPSQATTNLIGGTPDGAPCSATNQCRPGRVCSSANLCEMPRAPGTSCTAERDCQRLSACENGVCTQRGLLLGQSCGSGKICAEAFDCVNNFCAAKPLPAPSCPPNTSLQCLPGCSFKNGECRNKFNRLCPPRTCRP